MEPDSFDFNYTYFGDGFLVDRTKRWFPADVWICAVPGSLFTFWLRSPTKFSKSRSELDLPVDLAETEFVSFETGVAGAGASVGLQAWSGTDVFLGRPSFGREAAGAPSRMFAILQLDQWKVSKRGLLSLNIPILTSICVDCSWIC